MWCVASGYDSFGLYTAGSKIRLNGSDMQSIDDLRWVVFRPLFTCMGALIGAYWCTAVGYHHTGQSYQPIELGPKSDSAKTRL
jgi:hypothetical protein